MSDPVTAFSLALDVLRYEAERAAESDTDLRLYAYRGKEEAEGVPLATESAWRDFASWALGRGPELERLTIEGHTDPYRLRQSVEDLREEIKPAMDEFPAIHDAIRKATDPEEVTGIVINAPEREFDDDRSE